MFVMFYWTMILSAFQPGSHRFAYTFLLSGDDKGCCYLETRVRI
jgi:hypothetical protein